MAIDPQSNGSPHKVTPAREHAPAGTANKSIAASGGQDYSPGDVDHTPSMTKHSHSGPTKPPMPDGGVGGAISDD